MGIPLMIQKEDNELIEHLKKDLGNIRRVSDRARETCAAPRPVNRAPEERQHSAASWRDARRVPPARGAESSCARDGSPPGRRRLQLRSRQPGPKGTPCKTPAPRILWSNRPRACTGTKQANRSSAKTPTGQIAATPFRFRPLMGMRST